MDDYFSLAKQMAATQAALLAPPPPDPWAGLTLFRFELDGTEMIDGTRDCMPLSIWAPNPREALKAAYRRHGATRGFVGIDSIDPMPTHVRVDGADEDLHDLSFVGRVCAMSLLCEQSGHTTHAEARAYLALLQAAPEEISKRLLAEYAPAEDPAELMAAGLANRIAAE